jgi:hypothetical protein
MLEDALVELQTLTLSNPTNDSIVMGAVIYMSGVNTYGLSPCVPSPVPLDLYYNNSWLGAIDLPPFCMTAGGPSTKTKVIATSVLNLTSPAQQELMQTFGIALLYADPKGARLDMQMRSEKVEVSVGGITISGVFLDTSISLHGLGNLTSPDHLPRITEFSLPANAPGARGSGVAMQAVAEVYNPSSVILDLGSITFDLFCCGGAVRVGRAATPASTSVVGAKAWSKLDLGGVLHPSDTAIGEAVSFFSDFVNGKTVTVRAVGVSVEHAGPWLNALVQAMAIDATVRWADGPLVRGAQAHSMVFHINSTSIAVSIDLQLNYKSPFDFPFGIDAAQLNATLHASSASGAPISTLATPWLNNVTLSAAEEAIYVSADRVPLQVSSSQAAAFRAFSVDMLQKPEASLALAGSMGANLSTWMSAAVPVPVRSIASDALLTFPACGGFIDAPFPIITSLDLVGGEPGKAHIAVKMKLQNPSSVLSIHHEGPLRLNLVYEGAIVGFGELVNSTLSPGVLTLDAPSLLLQTAANAEPRRRLLTQYLKGEIVDVVLQGCKNCTDQPLLGPAVASLSLPVSLPRIPAPVLKYIMLKYKFPATLGGLLTLVNPFSVAITLTTLDTEILYKNKTIGTAPKLESPITLPPLSHLRSPLVPVDLEFLAALSTLSKLNKGFLVDVRGTIDMIIGEGYSEVGLEYVQLGVPASAHHLDEDDDGESE